MANPAPCKQDIYDNGERAILLDGCSYRVEEWVQRIAAKSGQPVDWFYVGGRAVVVHLGDGAKVQAAIDGALPDLAETPDVAPDHSRCRCFGPRHSAMSVLRRP